MLPTVQLFGLQIPTFFLTMSLISILILFLIRKRAGHWYKNFYWLPGDFNSVVWSLALLVLVGGFIGGRMGHVLIEEPQFYLERPERLFIIWQGGFVFYGGFFLSLAFVCLFLFGKRKKQPLLYFDFFAPLIALSYLLGRLGCFLNGCCYGKVCELPWAISITDAQGLVYPRHPTQLYSVAWELVVLLILWIWQKKRSFYLLQIAPLRMGRLGSLFFTWLFLHSLGRFIIEFWRDDFRGPQFLLSPSGWISLLLMLISTYFIGTRVQSRNSQT
jgi:phosphatidylglycerol---prolipoprotein diacylglyceryl transferase